jgi:regulator of protease activity HflC (stomatin/prohibitin superfamily)
MEARKYLSGCVVAALLIAGVFIAAVLLSGLVTIDAGEVAAVTTMGELTGTAGPGLHVRIPFVQGYHVFSSRAVVYETSEHPETSDADFPDYQVDAQTQDGQQISVRFSVRYYITLDNVEKVYREVGQDMRQVNERAVKFHARSLVRLEMQKYPAGELYSGNLMEVVTKIEQELRPLLAAKGVTLDSFVVRKIAFAEEYVTAVEQKQIAYEGITTAKYQAEQATYKAQEEVERAKGTAAADIERAKGEAESLRLKGKALREYPEMLQLEFIQQLKNTSWGFLPTEGFTPLLPLPTPAPTPPPTQ